MAVYVRNLSIDSGADFSELLELTQTGGQVVNLTGFSAYSHMRKSPSSTKYTGIGVTLTDPANGKVTVSIAALKIGIFNSMLFVNLVLWTVSFGNILDF